MKFDPFEYPKIVPDVAESWTISPDGKVYEFKLRDGVKFHDGSILTSRDVKASLDHVIFPPTGVTSPRKAVYAQVEAVEAPNPRTVRVRLKRAQPGMLTFLASPWNYIYKADLLEKDPHWFKKNVMGTGPFKLAEYVPGSHVLGKKNPDYFVKGLPVPRRLPGAVHHRRRRARGRAPGRPGRRGLGRRHADAGPGRPEAGDGRQGRHPEEQRGRASSPSPSTTRRSRSTTRGCAGPSASPSTAARRPAC